MFTSFGKAPSFNVPQFETRRALVLINLQNDFFDTSDELVICKPADFVDHIKALIPFYRKLGDVVWVRTEIDETLAPPPRGTDIEEVAQGDHLETGYGESAPLVLDDEFKDVGTVSPSSSTSTSISYYPRSRTRAMMRRLSSKTGNNQLDARSDSLKERELHDYLAQPKKKKSVRFRPGTRGAEISDNIMQYFDATRDLVVIKHHYSAFDATSLLLSLRMKLVTDIYLCGCLSNVSVYATAADAVRHGFGVYVIEDCLGYRSESNHIDAMRQMADIMGVSGIDSEELIMEAGGRVVPDADVVMFTGPGVEGISLQPLPLELHDPASASDFVRFVNKVPASSSQTPRSATSVADKQNKKHSRPDNQSNEVEEDFLTLQTRIDTSTEEHDEEKPDAAPQLQKDKACLYPPAGPGDSVGEGDSKILHDALTNSLVKDAFQLLRKEVDWQKMRHRSGEVPRLVAVQGDIGNDGTRPIYRHPADESPVLSSFTPVVCMIRDEVQKILGQPLNHALIQLYRGGQDNISEHSDKTLDIARGSSIANVSLGAERFMTLRTKKSVPPQGADNVTPCRQTQRVPLPHNSIFVLGPQTNLRWLHGIRPDKRPLEQKRAEEKTFGTERISITYRQIKTFSDENECKIWGQGARSKSPTGAGRISTTRSAEMESMIIAFGKENRQVDFDWDMEYGTGFDVINLVSNTTKLYLCQDEVANLRVLLSLSERRVPCEMIRGSPTEPASPKSTKMTLSLLSAENPIFRDSDEDTSEIVGDLAILFYLGRFYPIMIPPDVSAKQIHRLSTQTYSRTTQANDLLILWRRISGAPLNSATSVLRSSSKRPGTPNMTHVDEFKDDMEVWEEYAGEDEYMGGGFYSLIDCAFWPVLNIIVQRWDGWSGKSYPDLAGYHRRVEDRKSVKKALGQPKC